ncbi:MAG: MBL fold metallo-hydrolase, partial [Methanobrevibacter sp.]|nr:MBL fold metallo-hydrolase [Candidatus Methanovirga basalitermitum]
MEFNYGIVQLKSTIKSHVFLIPDTKGYTLIDASYPNDGEKIISELGKLKVDLKKIHSILITHSDWDHIGSLKYLYDHLNVKVYCSKTEYDNWMGKCHDYSFIPEKIKQELLELKKIMTPITKDTIGDFKV